MSAYLKITFSLLADDPADGEHVIFCSYDKLYLPLPLVFLKL